MNNQQAFNKMVRHLRKQNKRSSNQDGGICSYRTYDGLRCAVGSLIPNRLYDYGFEHQTIEYAMKTHPPLGEYLAGVSLNLMQHMQAIHDDEPVGKWEQCFKEAAKKFNLTLPKLTGGNDETQ
jgi:hypothetical protein